jgi:hypothetical protein
MKPSHFFHSGLLVALISFINPGLAQSAETQPTGKAVASGNTSPVKKVSAGNQKALKAKSASAGAAKSGKVNAGRKSAAASAGKPAVIRLASNNVQQYSPPPANPLTINPYFVNQPAAILPRSVSASMAALAAAAPAVNAGVVPAPAAAPAVEPKPGVAAPAVAVPPVAAIPAAPVQSTQKVEQPVAVAKTATETVAQPNSILPQTPIATRTPSAPVVTRPGNPYLANPYFANQPNYAPTDPAKIFSQFGDGLKISSASLPFFSPTQPTANPAQPNSQNAAQSAASDASGALNKIFTSLKMMLPLTGDSNILPTIKKVYPTGEKPLVVINFKCPTEVIGITPPPMKLLHEAVNLGFEGINKTNLLSFNLQQVCS